MRPAEIVNIDLPQILLMRNLNYKPYEWIFKSSIPDNSFCHFQISGNQGKAKTSKNIEKNKGKSRKASTQEVHTPNSKLI